MSQRALKTALERHSEHAGLAADGQESPGLELLRDSRLCLPTTATARCDGQGVTRHYTGCGEIRGL